MSSVHQFMRRITEPAWMHQPDAWMWRRPDGAAQGFGASWREDPGQANLLWLAMGLDRPPRNYDACGNALYMFVLIKGQRLAEQASLLSLEEFSRLRGVGAEIDLIHLAQRRLHVLH
jgi:hypothetical protein